jgi:hypothetical protein
VAVLAWGIAGHVAPLKLQTTGDFSGILTPLRKPNASPLDCMAIEMLILLLRARIPESLPEKLPTLSASSEQGAKPI